VEQDNKMTSSNLGIVFGPTLMRPRPTDATISLSSLVDYPHQARIIEALIIFYSTIFETKESAVLGDSGKYGTGGQEEAAGCPDLVGVSGREQPRGAEPGRTLPLLATHLASPRPHARPRAISCPKEESQRARRAGVGGRSLGTVTQGQNDGISPLNVFWNHVSVKEFPSPPCPHHCTSPSRPAQAPSPQLPAASPTSSQGRGVWVTAPTLSQVSERDPALLRGGHSSLGRYEGGTSGRATNPFPSPEDHKAPADATVPGESVTPGSLCPAEPGDRSVDSDSELEDSGELLAAADGGSRTQLTKQESETSTDEAQFCDDGSEGQRSRSCSMGQSDTEGSAPRCRSPPGEEQSDAEEPPESRLLAADPDYNTNQSNNTAMLAAAWRQRGREQQPRFI